MCVRLGRKYISRQRLAIISALTACVLLPAIAQSEEARKLSIPRGPLATVLTEIAKASGIEIAVPEALIQGKVAGPIEGQMTIGTALNTALAGTNLEVVNTGSGSYAVKQPSDTAQASAPEGDVPAVVVTDVAASPHQDEGFKAGNAGDTVRLGDAPIKEIPIPVSAVTKDVIASQSPTSAASALSNVAGIYASDPENGLSVGFTIRGFRNSGYTINGSRVANTANLPIDAVERLEVLKGPTSLLTGSSAEGGLVNVVTKMPTSDTIRELVTRIGPNGFASSALDLGGAVGESQNLTYRLVVSGMHADVSEAGYFDPSRYHIAPALEWSDDVVTISGGVSYGKQQLVRSRPWSFVTPFDPAVQVSTYPGIAVLNPDIHLDNEVISAKSDQKVNLGKFLNAIDLTFNNTIDYSKSTIAGYSFAIFGFLPSDEQDYSLSYSESSETYFTIRPSLTLKVENAWAKSTLKAGYDYQAAQNSSRSANQYAFDPQTFTSIPTNLRTGPVVPLFDPYNPVESATFMPFFDPVRNLSWDEGLYVVEKLDLFTRLHLMGSLRRDWNIVKNDGSEKVRTIGDSFMIGASLDVTDEFSPYVNYSNGFVPGSATSTSFGIVINSAVTSAVIPPEGRTLKEAGGRFSLFNDRLRATASIFELTRTNASIYISDGSGLVTGVRQTAGLQTRGLELDIQGEILPGWNIIGSYGHINAAVLDETTFSNAADPTAGIPKNVASIWTTYSIPMEWVESVTFGGGMRAVSSSHANRFPSHYSLDGYAIADAMLAVQRDGWTVQLNVNNVFDKQALIPSFESILLPHEAERSWLLTVRKQY